MLTVMVRKSASTAATGGGGYTFADKVAAGFLVQMLKRKFSLEIDLGVITALHFETRDAGHVLDDLQLALKRGQDDTRCLVSVKSNRQHTGTQLYPRPPQASIGPAVHQATAARHTLYRS